MALQRAADCRQGGQDDDHGRDDEVIRPEEDEGEDGTTDADQLGGMIREEIPERGGVLRPLADENDDEHRR